MYINRLILLVIGVLLLVTVQVSAGAVFGSLEEGEGKIYTLNGKNYDVRVLIIEDTSPETVIFRINGEIIGPLDESKAEFLDGGTLVGVFDLINNDAGEAGSGDIVEFFIFEVEGDENTPVIINEIFDKNNPFIGGKEQKASNSEGAGDIFSEGFFTLVNKADKDFTISILTLTRDDDWFSSSNTEIPKNSNITFDVDRIVPETLDAVDDNAEPSASLVNTIYLILKNKEDPTETFVLTLPMFMQRENKLSINADIEVNGGFIQNFNDSYTISSLKEDDMVRILIEVENLFQEEDNVIFELIKTEFDCDGIVNIYYDEDYFSGFEGIRLKPEDKTDAEIRLQINENSNGIINCVAKVFVRDMYGALHGAKLVFDLFIEKEENLSPDIYRPASYKLSDYPYPFYYFAEGSKLTVVVGAQSHAIDSLILADIVTGLQAGSWEEIDEGVWIDRNSEEIVGFTDNFKGISSLLDTEIGNDFHIQSNNLIIVGHPCENILVKKLSSYKCELSLDGKKSIKGLASGVGVIEIVKNGVNSALVITAQDPIDRRAAAKVLGNYQNYRWAFSGEDKENNLMEKNRIWGITKIFVSGTLSRPQVVPVLEKVDNINGSKIISFIDWGVTAPFEELVSTHFDTIAVNFRPPSSSEMGKQFEFFQITISFNPDEIKDSYDIYFNLPKASLGSVSPNDVRLYLYEEGLDTWKELQTTFLEESDYFFKFKATTPHFSNFVAAQIPAQSTQPSSSSGGSSGSGGGGGGSGIGRRIAQEQITQQPEPIEIPRTCSLGYRMNEREACVSIIPESEHLEEDAQPIESQESKNNLITGFTTAFDGFSKTLSWKIIVVVVSAIIIGLLIYSFAVSEFVSLKMKLRSFYINLRYFLKYRFRKI